LRLFVSLMCVPYHQLEIDDATDTSRSCDKILRVGEREPQGRKGRGSVLVEAVGLMSFLEWLCFLFDLYASPAVRILGEGEHGGCVNFEFLEAFWIDTWSVLCSRCHGTVPCLFI
jgi:hypothetical protein